MRIAILAAAAAALWVQPANAVEFLFSVKGYVPVEEHIYYTQNQDTWPAECAGQIICDPPSTFYIQKVDFPWVPGSSTNGVDFTFDVFDAGPREGISGTARYLGNGVYEGLTLNYFVSPLGIFDGPFRVVNGQTNSFSIYQIVPPPVPEPATWASLLIGFFALGAALRRRRSSVGALAA